MSSALRTIAVGGFAGFVTAITVATAVQPDAYDSTRDLISGLAGQGASHPWIMITGCQLAAAGLVRPPSASGSACAAGPGGPRPSC
jgi:hypothetical protein